MTVGDRYTPSVRPVRAAAHARGDVRVPGSKSVTNRHLNLVLVARRPVLIEHPLLAEDTRNLLLALRQAGMVVSGSAGAVSIAPGKRVEGAAIHCGASGTMLRFLTASLAATEGVWRLDGSERLRRRPLGPLIGGLRELGADIRYLDAVGYAPVLIRGRRLRGGRVRIAAAESSQYVSALVMAGTRAEAKLDIDLDALASKPYLDLTIEAVTEWGGEVEWSGPTSLRVEPSRLAGGRIRIEGDFSSACYFAAGAALLGGRLKLYDLRQSTRQGDRRFLDLLLSMGFSYRWESEYLEVEGTGSLRAVDIDMSDMPDQVPTLAALAPFAVGTTRIKKVAHLRLKESDRLAEIARGLRMTGAVVEEGPDGLVIPGVWAETRPPESAVVLDSANDHRLAMSFALLGLRRPGISIAEPQVVAKSYPGFWRDFERCFES